MFVHEHPKLCRTRTLDSRRQNSPAAFRSAQVELTFPTAFERLHVGFYRSKITSWMAAQEEDYRCGVARGADSPPRMRVMARPMGRGIMRSNMNSRTVSQRLLACLPAWPADLPLYLISGAH